MSRYRLENLNFSYAGTPARVLREISSTIATGDFVVLCGPTGSGKTTLLRMLKPEVQPEGETSGSIYYDGAPLAAVQTYRSVREIGMVFQDPDAQIVMETAAQELAFGLENLGFDSGFIQRRLAEVSSYFGLESWLPEPIHQLSGGQKQLLNLASVLMLRPRVLLLDEPTAQLDPVAAREFLQSVHRLNQELSTTVIISEHRLEEVFPLATQVLMLDRGQVSCQGPPEEVARRVWNLQDQRFREYLPSVSRLFLNLNGQAGVFSGNGPDSRFSPADPARSAIKCHPEGHRVPLTVRDARIWLDNLDVTRIQYRSEEPPEGVPVPANPGLLQGRRIDFQYQRDQVPVLQALDLELHAEDFLVLLGGNGSGKTTLLKVLAGILRPQRGRVLLDGQSIHKMSAPERTRRLGYLAQNPALYFCRDSVQEQLWQRVENLGLSRNDPRVDEVISLFDLAEVMERHPHDLSGGQQQKLALALVLLSRPQLLLLDEPTKGLDPIWKLQLARILQELQRQGSGILMVSHDIEFTARFARRCALLFQGRVVAPDTPRDFFRQNHFYTTVVQRALGDRLPRVLALEDVTLS